MREWRTDISGIPPQLRHACIDYKMWKKLIKTADEGQLMMVLADNLKTVDSVLLGHKRGLLTTCMCDTPQYSNDVLYKFALFNRRCLLKVIKRCDKLRGTRFREWYDHQTTNSVALCNLQLMKTLELELHGCNEPCPICLDVPNELVVLDCGHFLCTPCLKDLYGVGRLKGTICNLINYSQYCLKTKPKCPVCRNDHPIHDVNKIKTWTRHTI